MNNIAFIEGYLEKEAISMGGTKKAILDFLLKLRKAPPPVSSPIPGRSMNVTIVPNKRYDAHKELINKIRNRISGYDETNEISALQKYLQGTPPVGVSIPAANTIQHKVPKLADGFMENPILLNRSFQAELGNVATAPTIMDI